MNGDSRPPVLDSTSRLRVSATDVKVNRSLAWRHFGRVLILVQAPGTPRDADWAEFLADSSHDPGETILILAGDTRLSPSQRAEAQRWQELHGTPAVLITDSVVARGVATALGWFGVKVEAFARRDIDRALHAAGVVASEYSDAKDVIMRITAALARERKQALAG